MTGAFWNRSLPKGTGDRGPFTGLAAPLIAVLAFLPACILDLPACGEGSSGAGAEARTVTIEMGGAAAVLEPAVTDAARQRGLMFRKELGADRGMLFVYPKRRFLAFWMKNTSIPLSIAFVRRDGKIINIEKMRPFLTEVTYESAEPCRFAIEMNRGWFERHGLKAGDFIHLPPEVTVLEAE